MNQITPLFEQESSLPRHYCYSLKVLGRPWRAELLVNRSSDRSCTTGMMYNKIHIISPGCPRPDIALQCKIVAENTIHFIHWKRCCILKELLNLYPTAFYAMAFIISSQRRLNHRVCPDCKNTSCILM